MNDLKRDESNKMVSGVLSGISKKYNWDLSLLRLIYFLLTLFTLGFTGVIVYLIAAMIIPPEDLDDEQL